MKRSIRNTSLLCLAAFLSFLVVGSPQAAEEESARFLYGQAFLESLHHCRAAGKFLQKFKESEKLVNKLKNLHLADGRFTRAHRTVWPFLRNKESAVAEQAKVVHGAIIDLQFSNKVVVRMLSGKDGLPPQQELMDQLAQVAAKRDEAWDLLVEAVLKSGPVLEETSRREKQRLVGQLNSFFGKEIRNFRKERKQVREGKMESKELRVDKIIFAVEKIDAALRSQALRGGG